MPFDGPASLGPLRAAILLLIPLGSTAWSAEVAPLDYGRDVRPILSENCFYCHGQDANHRKADLRLDTADGQKSVITPKKPTESELIKRILSSDASSQMPPPKSNRKLSAEQKAILQRWVSEGAQFEGHWAYQKPVRPPLPKVGPDLNPIDQFIQAKLATKGMRPSPEADRITLIRRVTFDLTGLPPTLEEVGAFVNDRSPDAYEKLVDRLMKSVHYGERMALPWLDAARYADSNGFQQDGDTFQWVWRDWVVKALNNNMPFDRFTIEQLAGDQLPNPTIDQKVATAFNRNHLVNGEGGAIPEEQRFNILFDRVDVTATNWLGLTMACAQCHDHKYDPMTMRDYYGLLAAFNNLSESGVAGRQSSKTRVSPPFIEAPTPDQSARVAEFQSVIDGLKAFSTAAFKDWTAKVAADAQFPNKELRALILDAKPKSPADRDKKVREAFETTVAPKLTADIKAAETALNNYKADNVAKVMVMTDDRPRETFMLDRGEYLKPKEKVTFSTPGFLPPLPKDAPQNRLGLAQWLVSPENPLTARVAVNRAWQTIFGTGLVKTAEDFGVQSEVPEYQALLDWLAVEFRESGWDMKRLNRLMVTSATYKQSSKVTPELMRADPENRLYARSSRYRLPAMFLRDAALSASGLLDRRVGGTPVYPYQPEGIWDALAITKERDFTYPASSGPDLYRRSIYTFWRRTVSPANMFDASSRQACKVRSSVTNTPLHALTTLNDITWAEASRVLADKVMATTNQVDDRLKLAFRIVLSRDPREAELAVLRQALAEQRAHFEKDPAGASKLVAVGKAPASKQPAVELAAWSSVCLALFNLDEALTRQ